MQFLLDDWYVCFQGMDDAGKPVLIHIYGIAPLMSSQKGRTNHRRQPGRNPRSQLHANESAWGRLSRDMPAVDSIGKSGNSAGRAESINHFN